MKGTTSTAIVLALIGNALNIGYNIPLVWRVVKTRNADSLSMYFLTLRLLGSLTWIVYAVIETDTWIAISYTVTLLSSLVLCYVKCGRAKHEADSNKAETAVPKVYVSKV